MTRHNLDSHILWLLSNEVAPPARTSSTAAREPAHTSAAEEDTEQKTSRDLTHPPPAQATNVGQDSIRPAAPSTKPPRPQPRENTKVTQEEPMGRLTSGSGSRRPALLSQQPHALPTPTPGPSSLAQGYASFLRTNNATPSSKPIIDRNLSNVSRVLQTPQTPRQTPRPTPKVSLRNVESVDLTGDGDKEGELGSSSPSSAEIFGTSQVIWTEDAAWRPEPVGPSGSSKPTPRTGKKRKSDEISMGSARKKDKLSQRADTPEKIERASSEDFVDIDDMITAHPKTHRSQHGSSRAGSVRPTIETEPKSASHEDYSVTETISRVQTWSRNHKSASRPLPGGEVSNTPEVVSVTEPSMGRSKLKSTGSASPLNTVQVTASPARAPIKPHPTGSIQTPEKPKKARPERIIQDSEDDEEVLVVEKRSNCTPRASARSPKVTDTSKTSSRWKDLPHFEPDPKAKDIQTTKPRTGSPLRPISRNVGVKQDSAPSPFQRDSPTKVTHTAKSSQQHSSQQTPSSILSTEDKNLARLFLSGDLAIESYYARVRNLIAQNAITSVSYLDAGEVAPPKLKDERVALLRMKKAYDAVIDLKERHRAMIEEKVRRTREVLELLSTGADYSVQDEHAALLTQKIRTIEKETLQLLHDSGAIKDGFGTGAATSNSSTVTPAPASKNLEGSSSATNAHIVFQTQIPSSLGHDNPTSVINQRNREHIAPQPRSWQDTGPGGSSKFGNDPTPPSPSGQANLPEPVVERRPYSRQGHGDYPRPEAAIRQPNFYRDPTPIDYGFDGDNEIFDDWLRDEQEIQDANRAERDAPDNIDDDYEEFDDDADADMVEFAQEVEQRHSRTDFAPSAPQRASLPETSGSMPQSLKRTSSTAGKNMYSHVEQENAAAKRMPWYKEVKRALRERFKLSGFRHHQLDAINATLDGKDAFVLMPTGGGKSLCYQLPAVVQTGKTKGVTVVISPLLSLMADQVSHLRKLNIRAASLNSDMPADMKAEVMNHLREYCPEQFIELLYITPEMINKSGNIQNVLTRLHHNKKLARIVIDEAHCVSQWGHDFRPDYVALGEVRKLFPNVPYMALTATATENVKVDVMHNLGMGNATVYSQSFNRPNLHYAVRSKKGRGKVSEFLDDIVELINTQYKGQTGIIYTLSRKSCEQLAELLQNQHGINAHHFHASMGVNEKARVQRQWQSGAIKIVVATIAFGMGIDKPDVRFVIHHTVPKSLEGYYQETGRAGRDGKMSGCYLYYGYQDTKVLKDFIYKSEGTEEQKERQRKMLQRMVQYCENRSDCRRVQVLHYFGEKFSKEDCNGTCDNCKSGAIFKTMDYTHQAQSALKIVKRVQDSHVTLLHCVDILRGSASAKIKNLGHDEVPGFGAAKDINRGEVERLFYRLLMENALAEHNVINRAGFATQYMNLGPNCRDFMTGHRKLKLQVKVSASPAGASKNKPSKPVEDSEMTLQSTLLTSPVTASMQRRRVRARESPIEEIDHDGYVQDDFVAPDDSDEDDYFEPVQTRNRHREETPSGGLGPPVTTDQRMEALPELHRVFVYQFVEEAKREVDRIKNDRNLSRYFFTEANLREMAISWTVTVSDMKQIPGINIDAVAKWGRQFIPILERYSKNYDDAMSGREDRDIDKNHQNVIDLCSDDDDDEYGLNESEEDAIREAEQGSKYFQPPKAPASSSYNRQFPSRTESGGAPRKAFRGGSFRRGSKGRKGGARRSDGSNSGQSMSGVSKRKAPAGGAKRSGVGGSSRGASTAGSKPSDIKSSGGIFKRFGNHGNPRGGGGGGGGMGGGIGMMPA